MDFERYDKTYDFISNGKSKAAIMSYEQYIENGSNFVCSDTSASRLLRMLISLLRNDKMFDEIQKVCDLTLSKKLGEESNCVSYIGKAECFKIKKDMVNSSKMYNEALKILDVLIIDNSTEIYFYLTKKDVLYNLKQYKECISQCELALEFAIEENEYIDIYHTMSFCYDSLAEQDDSKAHKVKALKYIRKAFEYGLDEDDYDWYIKDLSN